MLTLNPGSSCDVCAEEYGPSCLPHSIPCGHVLCANCCNTIIEKTSPRLAPVCPFCREQFSSDSVRLIRMDFSSSGWSTPRGFVGPVDANPHPSIFTSDAWTRKAERILLTEGGCSRSRAEARRLEDKVAKVAAKKCSVEEVSTLHEELQEWLTSDKQDDQSNSLYLSAALLRAILMNHLAHSEASKAAKTVETTLKAKLDDMEIANGKLEAELRKQRLQYAQKSQECQTLRTELSRLKALTTTLGSPPVSPPPTEIRRQSSLSPTPPSTSPTPPANYAAQTHSPLSRLNSVHVRSASLQSSARPSTPLRTAPIRSYTPAPAASARSYTPSIRSQTPGPPPHFRTHTPAPPPLPIKSRRLSQSSPPKISRSTSEEKAEAHERWIPPPDAGSDGSITPKSHFPSTASRAAAAAFTRFRDARSSSP